MSVVRDSISRYGIGAETVTICSSADISAGVEAEIGNYKRWTLYIHADDAIDITIQLSPDGSNWYEPDESPVSFDAAGDKVIEMGYDAYKIRLIGSNTAAVTAQVRGVYG